MNSLKNSPYYREALHELEYDFGTFYLFETFVVTEINEGVIFSWENHGKKASEEILDLYDSCGENLVYISNRIHNYSVVPSDWIKFFKNNYKLKGYGMVNYSKSGHVNSLLERLFLATKSKRFDSLDQAIQWARKISATSHAPNTMDIAS